MALLAFWEGRVKGCPVMEVLAQEVKSEGQIRDPNSLPRAPFPVPPTGDISLSALLYGVLALTASAKSEAGELCGRYCSALGLSFPCVPHTLVKLVLGL